METLICENCAAPIPISGIDRRYQLATCDHCGAIFDISSEVETGLLVIDPPAGVRIDRQADLWRASWRRNGEAATLVIVAVGISAAGVTMMPTATLGLLVAVLALSFLVMAHYEVSVTSVELTRSILTVESRVGFWGTAYRQCLDASDIEQVFVAERGPGRFELHIVTADNRHQNIAAEAVGGDLTMPVAFYLEQEIERFLKLRDRPVSGESAVKQALVEA